VQLQFQTKGKEKIMLKSAFLGCGGRSRGHFQAYQYVKNGKLVAVCDMDKAKLDAGGKEYGIPEEKRYTDIHEMLDKEKPDVLHIVTAPIWRVELMTIAAEHEVPVAIVEKPIALQGEDWKQLRDLSQKSKTKFAVNTQLHFHPDNLMLKKDVAEGKIGDIKFIEASARSTVCDQGVHVLELAHSYSGFAKPTRVFGNVSDPRPIDSRQPSPATAAATIDFEGGLHIQLLCGDVSPKTIESGGTYSHKRVAVYGTRGFIQWTMHWWERSTPEGGYERGEHNYGQQDVLAQAALTEAAFEWVKDESKLHPTRLERSLSEFNVLLGLYVSALNCVPVDLPFEPPDGIMEALKKRLTHSS
jgi:predicted dehydrogenase